MAKTTDTITVDGFEFEIISETESTIRVQSVEDGEIYDVPVLFAEDELNIATEFGYSDFIERWEQDELDHAAEVAADAQVRTMKEME